MKRRDFIAAIGGMVLAGPLAVRAQQPGRLPIVAFVHAVIARVEMAGPDPISPLARAFVHGLRGSVARRKASRNARRPYLPS
jgi:hypothetical protein